MLFKIPIEITYQDLVFKFFKIMQEGYVGSCARYARF